MPKKEKIDSTVIVVDDRRILRDAISDVLKRAGFKVVAVANGVDALPFIILEQHKS